MANSENTITSAFVSALRPMREAWSVNEQITRPFLNATQKPDVIVTEKGRNPVVIEVKIDGDTPNLSGETQAEAHFGMLLDPSVFTGLTYNWRCPQRNTPPPRTVICRTEHPRRKEIQVRS